MALRRAYVAACLFFLIPFLHVVDEKRSPPLRPSSLIQRRISPNQQRRRICRLLSLFSFLFLLQTCSSEANTQMLQISCNRDGTAAVPMLQVMNSVSCRSCWEKRNECGLQEGSLVGRKLRTQSDISACSRNTFGC